MSTLPRVCFNKWRLSLLDIVLNTSAIASTEYKAQRSAQCSMHMQHYCHVKREKMQCKILSVVTIYCAGSGVECKVDTRAALCYSVYAEIQMACDTMAARFLHDTELLDFAICQYTTLSYMVEMLLTCSLARKRLLFSHQGKLESALSPG